MRRMIERIAAATAIIALSWSGISMYRGYIAEKIYEESVRNLEATYGQVSQTFRLFTQRNWNVLSAYQELLEYTGSEETTRRWTDFLQKQENWQYSDFYLFNGENEYLTDSGRKGKENNLDGIFKEMYEKKRPVISSYLTATGERKIVYAAPLGKEHTIDGITYTGMAVTYDNAKVEQLITGKIYKGESDCYVVDSYGHVILSLAPKTEIREYVYNFVDYLREDENKVKKGSPNGMRDDLESLRSGSLILERDGESYYVVYEPLGIADWSVIGVVREQVVDGGQNFIKEVTTAAMLALATLIGVLLIAIIVREAQHRVKREQKEKADLKTEKDILADLYVGMQKVVDRLAVCNFKTGKYVYREQQLPEQLYPEEGRYEELVEAMSRRYVAIGDAEHMKLSELLSRDYLRKLLKDKNSTLKFEYMGRKKESYKLMSVVPVSYDEKGELERFLLIGVDVGEKHVLENMANTDSLTGLFNERYFTKILAGKENRNQPFILFYLDLDRFKEINDTYGHTTGDYVLQEAAKRLQQCIRGNDYAFRIGGDEFTLVISSDYDEAVQRRIEERLIKTITKPFYKDGHKLEVGCSLGAAAYPKEAADAAHTRILADERMYECKEKNHAGR